MLAASSCWATICCRFQSRLRSNSQAAAAVTATVASVDEENGTASITLVSKSEGVALYVWLSTLAHGRFEDNGFMLLPGTATLDFIAFGSLDSQSLQASLRVEHLGEHLSSPY